MRKIAAGLHVSLDGVTESPEKWSFGYFTDELQQVIQESFNSADTLLLGRRTYEEFADHWSEKTDDPIADYLNNTPKFVVSTTLKTLEWRNSTLVGGNVVDELTKLKQQPGKNIGMTGSVTLVRSLLRDGLLDELNLLLYPIVLGTGKHLFEEWADQMPLKLVDSRTLRNGVLSLTYGPASG